MLKGNMSRLSRENRLPKAVDLGLAVLCALQKEGETFTYDEIGAACGVTESSIFLIEKKALKKVRNRINYSNETAPRRELLTS